MKKLFIFDIDDVICSLKENIYQALKTEYGVDHHHSLWKNYDIAKHYYNIDNKDFFNVLLKYNVLENAKIETGIIELIDYLKQENIDVMALSARGWRQDGLQITQHYFENNNINIKDIKLVTFHQQKYEVINQIKTHDIIGFIDDNAKHISLAFEHSNQVKHFYIKDQPWNTDIVFDKKVQRVNNLEEVQQHLMQKLIQSSKIKFK